MGQTLMDILEAAIDSADGMPKRELPKRIPVEPTNAEIQALFTPAVIRENQKALTRRGHFRRFISECDMETIAKAMRRAGRPLLMREIRDRVCQQMDEFTCRSVVERMQRLGKVKSEITPGTNWAQKKRLFLYSLR